MIISFILKYCILLDRLVLLFIAGAFFYTLSKIGYENEECKIMQRKMLISYLYSHKKVYTRKLRMRLYSQ